MSRVVPPQTAITIVVVLIVLFVTAYYLGINYATRQLMGMSKTLSVKPGKMVAQSKWGHAAINGYSMNGCVRVIVYENGYLLKVMWICSGAVLWLEKNSIKVLDMENESSSKLKSKHISSQQNQITLYGDLTRFIP